MVVPGGNGGAWAQIFILNYILKSLFVAAETLYPEHEYVFILVYFPFEKFFFFGM